MSGPSDKIKTYHYNNPMAEWPLSKNHSIIYNDFRNELFYLYDVNWGDDSPNEFTSEPKRLGNNEMVYHTYASAGIYEVTGYMLRMKPDYENEPIGIIHNKRFTVRINISRSPKFLR